MHEIQILQQHPKKALDGLKRGEIERMELAVEQITDEFMVYSLRGGLIDALSKSFPDPRKECEITVKQILSASMAGNFQDMYAISQSPYCLRLTPKVVHLKPVFIVLPRTMITGILTPYFFSFPSDNILSIYAMGDT